MTNTRGMHVLRLLLAGSLVVAAPVPKAVRKFPPDRERIQGAWEIVVNEANGKPKAEKQVTVWTFDGDNMHSTSGNSNWVIKIDSTQMPKHIDISNYRGIYEFDGDRLTIAYGHERPTEVKSNGRNYPVVLVRSNNQSPNKKD